MYLYHSYLFSITIAKFSTVAKLTHNRYGSRSNEAVRLCFEKLFIVNTIATHKSTISNKASVGFLSPKENYRPKRI